MYTHSWRACVCVCVYTCLCLCVCVLQVNVCVHVTGYLSQMLLQREWLDSKGQREKGAVCNEMLQTLIK